MYGECNVLYYNTRYTLKLTPSSCTNVISVKTAHRPKTASAHPPDAGPRDHAARSASSSARVTSRAPATVQFSPSSPTSDAA
jgi:hypothetical protein